MSRKPNFSRPARRSRSPKSVELVPFTCSLCELVSYDPIGWLTKRRPICEHCALELENQREHGRVFQG